MAYIASVEYVMFLKYIHNFNQGATLRTMLITNGVLLNSLLLQYDM